MSEGGKFYGSTKETPEAVGFYDNMRKQGLLALLPNESEQPTTNQ